MASTWLLFAWRPADFASVHFSIGPRSLICLQWPSGVVMARLALSANPVIT